MNKAELIRIIKDRQSFLCVGLDTDINKIPKHLHNEENPLLTFNKQIIDATKDVCVSYKLNSAFYESYGTKGWEAMEQTAQYIGKSHFVIADAKRGDIGNTSNMYAQVFFKNMDFDAITLSPYMGHDSIEPYLEYDGKWAILLALTSNPGAMDFEMLPTTFDNKKLYEKVLIRSQKWGTDENLMYVIGATRGDLIEKCRALVPNHFLLVPGVGVQGGSLEEAAKYGMNKDCGLLVNSSRGIIYAGDGENFAEAAKEKATELQQQMSKLLVQF